MVQQEKIPSPRERVEMEIASWYEAFYAWSRGLVPKEEHNVKPIYDALSPEFCVVLTDGRRMGKEEYWKRLVSLHGDRRGSPRSEITEVSLKQLSADFFLAAFDLVKEGVPKKKVDTAILQLAPSAPCGVFWVHVHESDHEMFGIERSIVSPKDKEAKFFGDKSTAYHSAAPVSNV